MELNFVNYMWNAKSRETKFKANNVGNDVIPSIIGSVQYYLDK